MYLWLKFWETAHSSQWIQTSLAKGIIDFKGYTIMVLNMMRPVCKPLGMIIAKPQGTMASNMMNGMHWYACANQHSRR